MQQVRVIQSVIGVKSRWGLVFRFCCAPGLILMAVGGLHGMDGRCTELLMWDLSVARIDFEMGSWSWSGLGGITQVCPGSAGCTK